VYNITRQQASEILWISTRSVDRYIKSWKIRAEKQWKVVMLNDEDIKNLSWESVKIKQKIIVSPEVENIEKVVSIENNKSNSQWLVRKAEYEKILATFDKMFNGFREEIKEKDNKIQELSIELWRAREQKENSIDLMEYKKVQFLSEEAKKSLSNTLEKEKAEKEKLNKELKYEKTTNRLLIIFIVILFIISWVIFFMNI